MDRLTRIAVALVWLACLVAGIGWLADHGLGHEDGVCYRQDAGTDTCEEAP